MNNADFIKEFIRGERTYGAYCHLGYSGDKLINYSTVLCIIDRKNKKAQVNVRKYSSTTSRIQSRLRTTLTQMGYSITEYEGEEAYIWNGGYQGVENVTIADMRRA